jgi:hypothetical protein
MSAFQVSKAHIDRLVALAVYGPHECARHRWDRLRWCPSKHTSIQREITADNVDEVGAMLTRANLRSVNARYPDTVGNPQDIPGDSLSAFLPYRFPWSVMARNDLRPSTPEALRAISCFEYQACESDDWRDSEAYRFCDALRRALCSLIAEDADRGWDDWDRDAERATEATR